MACAKNQTYLIGTLTFSLLARLAVDAHVEGDHHRARCRGQIHITLGDGSHARM